MPPEYVATRFAPASASESPCHEWPSYERRSTLRDRRPVRGAVGRELLLCDAFGDFLGKHQRRQPGRQLLEDRRLALAEISGQHPNHDQHGRDTDRKIHHEHPLPALVVAPGRRLEGELQALEQHRPGDGAGQVEALAHRCKHWGVSFRRDGQLLRG